MNKKILFVGALLMILVGCTAANQPASNAQPTASSAQKLQDTRYANYSYLIFPGTISVDAQQALTGFDMQTQAMPDGSTQVTLIASKQGDVTQQFIVKPGQSLYFIETSLGDDFVPNEDTALGDDLGVLVDKDGYIVK